MAEHPLPQHTLSSQDANNNLSFDGAGSSREARRSGVAQAPLNLPLRQAMQAPRPEPKVHDVTEKFITACNGLEVGQLVKDDYFTLFESIGALEIMDPKMDSGFLHPGETLEDTYDALTPLLPEEIIGIMDQLLCHEMAWHTGYPLSQTLFTSIYIDKLLWPEPRTLVEAQFYRGPIADSKRPGTLLEVLRAYCLAIVKCCDFVIAKITGRDYFEEEDFCTHTYNRVLFVHIPIDVFLRELDAAMETLEESDFEINEDLRSAILTRLQFRKDFLAALDLDCPLDHLYQYWPPIITALSSVEASQHLGKPVPSSFSPKIQRRMASTVPPRPIVELEFKNAFGKLRQLCIDCEEATRFTSLPSDPLEYESFLWGYASRSPTPLPYSRAYLATTLFHQDTLNTTQSLPLIDLKTLTFPASPVLDPTNWTLSPPRDPLLPRHPRLQLAMLIDEFLERAGPSYLEYWTALGQNRCRLRRLLTHVIIGWDMLQIDAETLDDELMRTAGYLDIEEQVLPLSLTTWVYQKKLFMVEKAILLGFEQDIYLPDEYAGMYHFLSTISAHRMALLCTILDHFNKRRAQCLENNDFVSASEIEDDKAYIDILVHDAAGIGALSAALSKFYTVLLYLNLVPQLSRPFSTEELRYELRMKPFLTLNPPEVPPFQEFLEQTQCFGPFNDPRVDLLAELKRPQAHIWAEIEERLKAAKEAFSKVKKLGARKAKAGGVELTWAKDIQGVLASCIALGVAVISVKNAVAAFEGSTLSEGLGIRVDLPEIEKGRRYAEAWIVGKVIKV